MPNMYYHIGGRYGKLLQKYPRLSLNRFYSRKFTSSTSCDKLFLVLDMLLGFLSNSVKCMRTKVYHHLLT